MYSIIEIPPDVSAQLEQLGTKAKDWLLLGKNNKVLFKEGRPGTGENWAEKVCCEICALLDVPHAHYDLALWGKRKGVISPTFVPDDARLIHGNEVLTKIYTDYVEMHKYKMRHHTLRRVIAVLKDPKVLPPLNWPLPHDIVDSLDVFVGYLLLDALVGNQDRHHENWAILNSVEFGLRLAPTYDHAMSLGRNETDETRLDRLYSNDQGRRVEHYTTRARSGFFKSISDKKAMSTFNAFQEAAKIRPNAGRYWLARLKNITLNDFKHVVECVPKSEMSQPAQFFALKMLEINQNRLLNL